MSKNQIYLNTGSMVNYTTATTAAQNEEYISSTDSPDSLSFLTKNTTVISFSLIPSTDEGKESPTLESYTTTLSTRTSIR